MAEEQRNKIYSMLKELNDDTLIKSNESPNENIIYHLYDDGNITSQKGGWAYGDRSEFISVSSINIKMNLNIDKFKYKRIANNITYGYIIVSYENARKIRAEMEKLVELIQG